MRNIIKSKVNLGIALISVLWMTVILSAMTISLIALNSNHLFYVSRYYDQMKVLNLAETGAREAILKFLDSNYTWGHNTTDELFWASSDQELHVNNMNFSSKSKNSSLNLGTKGLFYITFNSGQTNYPYSVNNLNGSAKVQGYDKMIPPYSANIIVTAISGQVVKHVDVVITRVLNDKVVCGSKDAACFWTSDPPPSEPNATMVGTRDFKFSLSPIGGGSSNFHSNDQIWLYVDPNKISIEKNPV